MIDSLIQIRDLTGFVYTFHKRGVLCPWLYNGCPPAEVFHGKSDNRTDIYRIGIRLFLTVVLREDGSPLPFHRQDYRRIPQLLNRSSLWKQVSPTLSSSLKPPLTHILLRTLAPCPNRRYGCCEELLDDLDALIRMLTEGRRSSS